MNKKTIFCGLILALLIPTLSWAGFTTDTIYVDTFASQTHTDTVMIGQLKSAVDLTSTLYVNVLTYGATNTDTSDDTVAIQAAIDAAGTDTTTGTRIHVYFPAGNYYISSQITIYQGTRLIGSSRTLVTTGGTRIVHKPTVAGTDMFTVG